MGRKVSLILKDVNDLFTTFTVIPDSIYMLVTTQHNTNTLSSNTQVKTDTHLNKTNRYPEDDTEN